MDIERHSKSKMFILCIFRSSNTKILHYFPNSVTDFYMAFVLLCKTLN